MYCSRSDCGLVMTDLRLVGAAAVQKGAARGAWWFVCGAVSASLTTAFALWLTGALLADRHGVPDAVALAAVVAVGACALCVALAVAVKCLALLRRRPELAVAAVMLALLCLWAEPLGALLAGWHAHVSGAMAVALGGTRWIGFAPEMAVLAMVLVTVAVLACVRTVLGWIVELALTQGTRAPSCAP